MTTLPPDDAGPMRPLLLPARPGGLGRQGAGFPLVCAPLVARDTAALLQEAAAVAALGPDLLEWRVDFFGGIADTAGVLDLALQIKRAAGGLPLLFTRRSAREGGQPVALSEARVARLYRAVCEAGACDLIDLEMGQPAADVQALRAASRAAGIGMILSFHDFAGTPAQEVLMDRFRQAEQAGADAAKLAVMPRGPQDVLTLLGATLQASRSLSIPVIGMAMGPVGALTRVCGWAFGSAMTFGVGQGASAPGQLPLADLQAGLALLRKAAGQ